VTLPIQRIREVLAPTYTIDRELGRGGMATVYLAQDSKHERVVALKVLHPELAASLGPTGSFANPGGGPAQSSAHPAALRFGRD